MSPDFSDFSKFQFTKLSNKTHPIKNKDTTANPI